jgi:predicted RNA-binding protein
VIDEDGVVVRGLLVGDERELEGTVLLLDPGAVSAVSGSQW